MGAPPQEGPYPAEGARTEATGEQVACQSPLPTRAIREVLTSLIRRSRSLMEALGSGPDGAHGSQVCKADSHMAQEMSPPTQTQRPSPGQHPRSEQIQEVRPRGQTSRQKPFPLTLQHPHTWPREMAPPALPQSRTLSPGRTGTTNHKQKELLQIHLGGHKDHVCQAPTRIMDEQISASAQRRVPPPGSPPG